MNWKWIGLFFTLLVLDIAAKMGAVAWIPPLYLHSYPFGGIAIFNLGGVLTCSLNTVVNTGAACGLFSGYPGILFGLRFFIITAIVVYLLFFARNTKMAKPLWVIVTGAIGNAIDYGLYGHVVDFCHFTFWERSFPVFNLADSYITLGVVYLLFQRRSYP